MAECDYSLLKGVQASCAATKKVGGLNKRIYMASVTDLSAVVFGTYNSVTSFTFKADKGFTKWTGRKEKNSAGSDVEVGENLTLRNQTVSFGLYYETDQDLDSIDKMLDAEQIFVVVETNPGTLEVFGINKVAFQNYGLRVTANPGNSGLLLNDSTAFTPALTGGFTNLQLIYNPAGSLSANIAALDLQTIDPAS